MTDELFKKMYEQIRVMFLVIFGCVVFGALIENKLAVLVGIFMILTISVVLIIAKYSKNHIIR